MAGRSWGRVNIPVYEQRCDAYLLFFSTCERMAVESDRLWRLLTPSLGLVSLQSMVYIRQMHCIQTA